MIIGLSLYLSAGGVFALYLLHRDRDHFELRHAVESFGRSFVYFWVILLISTLWLPLLLLGGLESKE